MLSLTSCGAEGETSPGAAPPSSPSTATADPAPATTCAVVRPRELLDGAPPGPGTPTADGLGVAWGAGRNQVIQFAGAAAREAAGQGGYRQEHWPAYQTVSVDGVERFVIPVGDFGVSSVQIRFVLEDCPYLLFLPAGTSQQASMDYAGRALPAQRTE